MSSEKELLEFSEGLIDSVNVPVIVGGGFDDMGHMNEILNSTNIEFFSMYRPFVAENDFLVKWKDDGYGQSRCLKCNNCYRTKKSTCYHF